MTEMSDCVGRKVLSWTILSWLWDVAQSFGDSDELRRVFEMNVCSTSKVQFSQI